MNQQNQLLAFASLTALANDREELSSKDVMAALYILLAEALYELSSDAKKVDIAFGRFCDIDEPLWFVRMRYFTDIYLSPTGVGVLGLRSGRYVKLLQDPNLKTYDRPVAYLLKGLSALDANVSQVLLDAGVSITDPDAPGPEQSTGGVEL